MSKRRAKRNKPQPSGPGRAHTKIPATARSGAKPRPWHKGWAAPLLLFATALLMRVLFTTATPDAHWAYTVAFKGDAPLWLDYAASLHHGQTFELGLPLHPPGTAYLLAWLGRGDLSGIPFLRFCWCLAGALTVVALWAAGVRSFGRRVGLVAGALAACSTSLMVLSSSLNSETPYLLLVTASFVFVEDLLRGARRLPIAIFAILNSLACLFRVEHVLAFLLVWAWLGIRWSRRGEGLRTGLFRLAVLGAAFVLPLVPWHVHAWRAISRLNVEAAPPSPAQAAALAAVEERTRGMVWEEEARRERDRLPAFARRTAANFVAATVSSRGRSRIAAQDFDILNEAFGSVPQPLSCCPFVSAYGPLNFALANHPASDGGFSRAALEDAPPLASSPERYPRDLVRGLPPPDLTLVYPPHLHLVNDGYKVGWNWIAERPRRFFRLAWRRLTLSWSGASLGFGGYDVPLGLSGVRRAVDMVVPERSPLFSAWQAAILGVTILGVAFFRKHDGLVPWMLFLASKAVVAAFFFGYARLGACLVPLVALCAALCAERWAGSSAGRGRVLAPAALGLLALCLALETVRWARPPNPVVDGQKVEAVDPFRDRHQDQRVEWLASDRN